MIDSDSDEGAAVKPGVVINGGEDSTKVDVCLFQDALSASRGDASPEVVTIRPEWIVKSTRRQNGLYY